MRHLLRVGLILTFAILTQSPAEGRQLKIAPGFKIAPPPIATGSDAGNAESMTDDTRLKAAKVPTDGPGLLEFFRQRTVDSTDAALVKNLIVQLGDDDFATRELASNQLVATGARARPSLREASKDSDFEVRRRALDCLRQIEEGATAQVVCAAVRTLAQRKPDGAAGVLLTYLPSAEDETVADEVRTSLAQLALRDGKPEPALIAALTDAQPTRRAAAGVAFCRAGVRDQWPAARKLLNDDDSKVRLLVALAFAGAKDKEAVPTLIDVLGKLPATDTGIAEDFLYNLAGDKGPSADLPTREAYRDAWKKWWDAEGKSIDLTKQEEAARQLGYTLVVLLDEGKAMELDADGKPRWTITGLQFPLDVQVLPGDRLLSAEHNIGKVTERDKQGKILWEYTVPQPLVAQRLPNGNTFIATRTDMMEVTKAGKEKWHYTRPGGEAIMKAQVLRNGDIAIVTMLNSTRYILLDRDRKEKRSFVINLHTSGGRIDVLPNGNVIVPENANNRVVEMAGADGKILWEVATDQPVMAMRLPNGNTLVTSTNKDRGAVELDRSGKEVWAWKADTRVTRALRR